MADSLSSKSNATTWITEQRAEQVARAFHESYEEWAREFGWATQEQSRVRWEDIPIANRQTMIATVRDLAKYGMVI
jgi:hypothetical protein